jgi:WD40 repeat protein
MLSSGYGVSETIREWNTATGQPTRTFGAKRRGRLPIALSADGALLASGEADGQIRLWDMSTGQEKRHWSVGSMPLWALAFSPDGKTLASAASQDVSIRLWDVATGREHHPSEKHIGPIPILRFAPSGKTLVSVGLDRRMFWWDVTEPTHRRQFSWSAQGEDQIVALSPDGNVLASATMQALQGETDRPIQLWDVRTGKPGLQLGKSGQGLGAIAFSPDGRLLASGGDNARVTLWDLRDGKQVRQIKGLSLPVKCLWFSPDGKTLAVGLRNLNEAANGRTLRLWDVASGEEKTPFEIHDSMTGLAFSPDGTVLAGGNGYREDACVRLWEIRTGRELSRHGGHRGQCGAIAFSADGKLVASATGSPAWADPSVHVWEAATGRLIRHFEGHRSVASVAFAPDGLSVASGGADSTILLWDLTGLRADGRWPARPLAPPQLEACWMALADADAAKAYAAVWAFVAAPVQAVPFLQKQLPPLPRPDAKIVARLIADLDSDDFGIREKATEELSKLGDVGTHALRQALASKPAPEVCRHLQSLLDQARAWTPERLRDHRAIQALDHIGTPAARDVLQAIAEGAPDARRTEEAKDVLRRLGPR